jgi:hypothetical protein
MRLGMTLEQMSSYAVFWRNGGGISFHGRLELDPHGLWLQGGEQGRELRVEVPYDEIIAVERTAQDRIGPSPAIRIRSRAAGSLLIASIGGVGMLSEIMDKLRPNIGSWERSLMSSDPAATN